MNEQNLVICDRDFRYANGLGENVMERRELALKVHTCTNLESLMQFSATHKIHILIIDESYTQTERAQTGAEKIFVLTKTSCKDLTKEEKAIYKFQCADLILAEIFETYCENGSPLLLKQMKKKKRKLVAVYSPIHRIGKTTFALAFAKEIARNERTLYLNLEEYAGAGHRFARAEGRNLADLLYYMRQEEETLGMRISMMLRKIEELDYIPPILLSSDLKDISEEEWCDLLERIRDETVYETIVLDLSESVQGLFSILKKCDCIYMPVLEDELSTAKITQFEEQLEQLELGEIWKKTNRFVAADDMEAYAKRISKEEI